MTVLRYNEELGNAKKFEENSQNFHQLTSLDNEASKDFNYDNNNNNSNNSNNKSSLNIPNTSFKAKKIKAFNSDNSAIKFNNNINNNYNNRQQFKDNDGTKSLLDYPASNRQSEAFSSNLSMPAMNNYNNNNSNNNNNNNNLFQNATNIDINGESNKAIEALHENIFKAIQYKDIKSLNRFLIDILTNFPQEIIEEEWKDTVDVLNSLNMLILALSYLQKIYMSPINRQLLWPLESVASYLNPFEPQSEMFSTLFLSIMQKFDIVPSNLISTFLIQTFFNSKNMFALHETLQFINRFDPNYELPAYIYKYMVENYSKNR